MGEEWASCTMCRALVTGQDVLTRAKERAVDWPKPISVPRQHESIKEISVNEAFDSLATLMGSSTRYCKRVHTVSKTSKEEGHCARYHAHPPPQPACRHVARESVAVDLPAGSYSVSNAHTNHTQVVNIEPGQSLNLAFTHST